MLKSDICLSIFKDISKKVVINFSYLMNDNNVIYKRLVKLYNSGYNSPDAITNWDIIFTLPEIEDFIIRDSSRLTKFRELQVFTKNLLKERNLIFT